MKEFFKLTTFLFIFVLSNKLAIAATATGNADVYKVIMRKVELCTGYTVVDFDDVGTAAACQNAVTIGSGDKEVDIASVSAGSAAAKYGDPALLPLLVVLQSYLYSPSTYLNLFHLLMSVLLLEDKQTLI